jgi:AraC-like DNA-binding protein
MSFKLKPTSNNPNPIKFKKEIEILEETTSFGQYNNNNYPIPFKKEQTDDNNTNTVDYHYHSNFERIIQLELENTEFSVTTLAKKMAVSQPVLYRKVHALTGLSVNEFIKSLRMKKASELLSTKAHNVSEVAYMVGFTDRKYFSKEFKKYFGKNPSNFE